MVQHWQGVDRRFTGGSAGQYRIVEVRGEAEKGYWGEDLNTVKEQIEDDFISIDSSSAFTYAALVSMTCSDPLDRSE